MVLQTMLGYSAVDLWLMFWMSTGIVLHTLLDKLSFPPKNPQKSELHILMLNEYRIKHIIFTHAIKCNYSWA